MDVHMQKMKLVLCLIWYTFQYESTTYERIKIIKALEKNVCDFWLGNGF